MILFHKGLLLFCWVDAGLDRHDRGSCVLCTSSSMYIFSDLRGALQQSTSDCLRQMGPGSAVQNMSDHWQYLSAVCDPVLPDNLSRLPQHDGGLTVFNCIAVPSKLVIAHTASILPSTVSCQLFSGCGKPRRAVQRLLWRGCMVVCVGHHPHASELR